MRRHLLPLLLLALLAGCGIGGSAPEGQATQADLEKIKLKMTDLFGALEMYANDHSLAYPDKAAELVPKYIEAVPTDPVGNQPLTYEKTERGYLIRANGDYTGAGAAKEFPQMNQDGFFALKAEDFPNEDLPDS